jgi:hypothetical protein
MTDYVDPNGLEALLANRGVALNKDPGIRPIGVGEMLRRIIGKAVLEVFGVDVEKAAGPLQLCAGQSAGVEAGIHAMRLMFESENVEGALFIDAENAFNKVNRSAGLWNVHFLCPALKRILTNMYRAPSRIFLKNEKQTQEFSSDEGTTQGDPLAMAMYAISIAPLGKEGKSLSQQIWYADDAAAGDTLERLRKWFDFLLLRGPKYGYFPQPKKCILVVKEHKLDEAKKLFSGTNVEITINGTRHLGAALGSVEFKGNFVGEKVKEWISQVELLSRFAKTQPHAAFAVFTHCLQARWTFVSRTVPGAGPLFVELEKVIRHTFLPSILGGRAVTDAERELLSLPARYGGLGVFNPCVKAPQSHKFSEALCTPLVRLILKQEDSFDPLSLKDEQKIIKKMQEAERDTIQEIRIEQIQNKESSPELKRAIEIARQKGASSWVTAMPTEEHETVLHKKDFVDAIYIRYGWQIPDLPEICVCGKHFDVQHSLDCGTGGFRTLQHNEVRDLVADCLIESQYRGVVTEPDLIPLSGEIFEHLSVNKDEEARSDVKCLGFWRRMRQAFFDIKVISPYARSYLPKNHKQMFREAEQSKNREYKARINQVEHADFNPLIFTTAGGFGPQSQLFLKQITQKLAHLKDLCPSVVAGWLRCRFSFALLRTTLVCLRGTRKKKFAQSGRGNDPDVPRIDVERALSESRIPY